jgi:retron-type reverse transcriptase
MQKYTIRYSEIITTSNLLQAWQEFLRGKKKRGDVAFFQARLMDNIFSLQADLLNKTYVHGGYIAFNISDPKPRNIHKARVRDRLLHHVIYNALYPYFDSKFIYDSYSCRVQKGTHLAINRFRDFGRIVSKNNTKTCWVLKCDIRKFFASIDHKILKEIIFAHFEDQDIIWLIGQVIDSFSTKGKPAVGLPLGNLTSQLLVNLYMNQSDQFVKRELHCQHYIRYADDFVFLSNKKENLTALLPKVSDFLEKKLQLSLHPNKLFIKTFASGVDFLGWIHFPHHRVLRTATKRRMLKNIADTQDPAVIASYKGMLSHGNAHELSQKIGQFSDL